MIDKGYRNSWGGALFSVLIPTKNGGKLLLRCLKSLYKHGPAGLHVVIIADGAPDLLGIRYELPDTMSLELVALERSFGFCYAVNRGLEVVRHEWVQLLNDDAFVTEKWFEPILACLKDPQLGAVSPLILQDKPGEIVDSAGDTVHTWGRIRKRYRGRPARVVPKVVHPVLACGGCAGFFRAVALREIGGWDEALVAYFDDVDVSLRLREAGWKIVCQPHSIVIHSGSQSYGPPVGKVLRLQSRNEEWIFLRYPNRVLGAGFARFIWNALRLFPQLIRGTAGPFLMGKWEAWAGFHGKNAPKRPDMDRKSWPFGA